MLSYKNRDRSRVQRLAYWRAHLGTRAIIDIDDDLVFASLRQIAAEPTPSSMPARLLRSRLLWRMLSYLSIGTLQAVAYGVLMTLSRGSVCVMPSRVAPSHAWRPSICASAHRACCGA